MTNSMIIVKCRKWLEVHQHKILLRNHYGDSLGVSSIDQIHDYYAIRHVAIYKGRLEGPV